MEAAGPLQASGIDNNIISSHLISERRGGEVPGIWGRPSKAMVAPAWAHARNSGGRGRGRGQMPHPLRIPRP